jgi:U6 snRNA-associated Sm-like protein LSm1
MDSLIPFTTSGALVDCVDSAYSELSPPVDTEFCETAAAPTDIEKILVVLRDGRKLIGVLRSYDQFGMRVSCGSDGSRLIIWLANLVIDMTVERTHLGRYYADKPVGVMVIRGENVVLLGEIVRSFPRPVLSARANVTA